MPHDLTLDVSHEGAGARPFQVKLWDEIHDWIGAEMRATDSQYAAAKAGDVWLTA